MSRMVFGEDITTHCQAVGLGAELLKLMSAPHVTLPGYTAFPTRVVSAIALAAAAGDKHRGVTCVGSGLLHIKVQRCRKREDAQEGAPGHLPCEDQRVERSEGTAPLTISVCAIAISDCKSWRFH